jgi:hypothetical protein
MNGWDKELKPLTVNHKTKAQHDFMLILVLILCQDVKNMGRRKIAACSSTLQQLLNNPVQHVDGFQQKP